MLQRGKLLSTALLVLLLARSFSYAAKYEFDLEGNEDLLLEPDGGLARFNVATGWHWLIQLPSRSAFANPDSNPTGMCVWSGYFPNPHSATHSSVAVDCVGDFSMIVSGAAGAVVDTVVFRNVPVGWYGIASKVAYPPGEYRRVLETQGRTIGTRTFWRD
jgi:hypothetical protein